MTKSKYVVYISGEAPSVTHQFLAWDTQRRREQLRQLVWETTTGKFTKLHTKGPSTKLMTIVHAILIKIILGAELSGLLLAIKQSSNNRFNRDFLSNRRLPESRYKEQRQHHSVGYVVVKFLD